MNIKNRINVECWELQEDEAAEEVNMTEEPQPGQV
jgi:hypothetical protein